MHIAQGLSSMGQPYLTEEQFSLLCQHYADPKRKDYICWKKFLQDVDQGKLVLFWPEVALIVPRTFPLSSVHGKVGYKARL